MSRFSRNTRPVVQSAPKAEVASRGQVSPLVDPWGRTHTDLRISVTDRCNLRCFYCMPPEGVSLLPRETLLHFNEIVRVVRVAVDLGIRKVRLTGGEPLLRKNLPTFIQMLAALPGLEDLAMTTNGTLLASSAEQLYRAGLRRLNISLDTVDRQQFQALTGQDALLEVFEGIEAARSAGFSPIKLNALAIRGFTESQVVPLVRFALERGLEIRFIEFMPIASPDLWTPERVLPAEAILNILREEFGSVDPVVPEEIGTPGGSVLEDGKPAFSAPLAPVRGPARVYRLGCTGARVGIIASISQPFCGTCTRIRLNAVGELRHCLFAQNGWDLRGVLRQGGTDEDLAQLFRVAVQTKPPAHGTPTGQFPTRHLAMCQIGG